MRSFPEVCTKIRKRKFTYREYVKSLGLFMSDSQTKAWNTKRCV